MSDSWDDNDSMAKSSGGGFSVSILEICPNQNVIDLEMGNARAAKRNVVDFNYKLIFAGGASLCFSDHFSCYITLCASTVYINIY